MHAIYNYDTAVCNELDNKQRNDTDYNVCKYFHNGYNMIQIKANTLYLKQRSSC